jgi:hypothetical protein
VSTSCKQKSSLLMGVGEDAAIVAASIAARAAGPDALGSVD